MNKRYPVSLLKVSFMWVTVTPCQMHDNIIGIEEFGVKEFAG